MIVLGILAVIFIILVGLYHGEVNTLRNLPLIDLKDIDLKTGDIIFMRCDYVSLIEPVHYGMFNLGNWMLSGGLETHVAVVVCIDGQPYIYQVEYKPSYDISTQSYRWKAPMIMNLEDYVMSYVGEVQYVPIQRELDQDSTIEFINQNKNIEFTINQIRWANTMLKIPSRAHKKYKFCVQLVTDYLRYMNVIDPEYKSHHMNPQDLKRCLQDSGWYGPHQLIKNSYADFQINNQKQTPFIKK